MRRRRRGFTTRWTVAGDEAARTITLPLVNSGGAAYNCTVNWGDGTASTITAYNDANRSHTYASDGTYDVEIRGQCEGWSVNAYADKDKVVGVLFWGDRPAFSGFKYLIGAFYAAQKFVSTGYGAIMPVGTSLVDLGYFVSGSRVARQLSSDMLRFCANVTNMGGFMSNCLYPGTIPPDFVRYCTSLTSVYDAFSNNQITSIPPDLLRYCPNLTNCGYAFSGNSQMTLNADCFYRNGEQATRFLGKTMNFQRCFYRSGAFTGVQGTAPDLWNCDFGETITLDVAPETDWDGGDVITGQTSGATALVVAKVSALVYKIKKHFGTFALDEVVGVTGDPTKLADQGAKKPTFTGTPVSTGCFSGHSIASLSNYADIPADWK